MRIRPSHPAFQCVLAVVYRYSCSGNTSYRCSRKTWSRNRGPVSHGVSPTAHHVLPVSAHLCMHTRLASNLKVCKPLVQCSCSATSALRILGGSSRSRSTTGLAAGAPCFSAGPGVARRLAWSTSAETPKLHLATTAVQLGLVQLQMLLQAVFHCHAVHVHLPHLTTRSHYHRGQYFCLAVAVGCMEPSRWSCGVSWCPLPCLYAPLHLHALCACAARSSAEVSHLAPAASCVHAPLPSLF